MDTVLQLIDDLEDILEQSRALPFSSKVAIDKDEIYDIITEIRLRLPNEVKQSKWVIEERNKIIIDAQQQAEELLLNAETQIKKLVDEHEITKRANEQSVEIIEQSKKTSREMRLGAMEYADEVLSQLEERIREEMDSLKKQSLLTEDFLNNTIDLIYRNRQELRGVKNNR